MNRLGPVLLVAFLAANAWAYDPNEVVVSAHDVPKELAQVGVDEHLGAQLDLTLPFTNEKGESVPLVDYFHRNRPVLMAMVYYNCPSLCNIHLNALTESLKNLKWTTGRDFDVVAISMDATETHDLAAKKKKNYLEVYGRPDGDSGWHFLVGSKDSVQKISSQLGFKFQWIEETQQFAHAAVAYVVTPDGKISRYLHGVNPDLQTVKLSLLEASNGKIGSMVEQVLMFCFQFDPKKNKYTLYAWNIMRIGAILMVLLLGVLLVPMWLREKSHKRT